MNIYDTYDIDYYNLEKKLAVKVISNQDKLFIACMDKNELTLEVHYDKNTKKFLLLDGSLGQKINKTDFSTELKLERILEASQNYLFEYWNPKLNTKKIP